MRSILFTLGALSMGALGVIGCEQAPAPTKDAPPETAEAAKPEAAEVMDECPGEQKDSCGDAQEAAADESRFGKGFALGEREALSAVTQRLKDDGATVQVSGTVDSVCAKKGCWMVLRDGDVTARVFTHAGDFYLPINTAKGRKAVVEGQLKAKTISEKFAKHLAEDKGEDPATVQGDQREWVMDATAIELL